MNRIVCVLSVLAVSVLCSAGEPPEPMQIGNAHGLGEWRSKPALRAGIEVSFGGEKMVEGTLLFDTPVGKSRLESADGTVMVFDGETAWSAPAKPMARFHLLTWPYFIAAPFKLSDPGVNIRGTDDQRLDGRTLPTPRMTFDPGTGDAPDDWYLLFRDPQSDRLVGMAYIVTYGGKPVEDAEKEVHAVVYDEWTEVEGVVIPTKMSFYNWAEDAGITGDPIGEAVITDPRFIEPSDDAFTAPPGAEEDAVPGG